MKKMNIFLTLLLTLATYATKSQALTLNDIQCIQTVGEVRCDSVTSDRYIEAEAVCAQNIVIITNENQRMVRIFRGYGTSEATLGEKGLAGFTLALALPVVAARIKISATLAAQKNLAFNTEAMLSLPRCNKQDAEVSQDSQSQKTPPGYNP